MRSSRAVILNPRKAEEHFVLTRYAPSAALALFVECHWVVRWDLRGREPYLHEALPHPCVNLALDAGGADSGVFGVFTKKQRRVLAGEGLVIGTRFKPGGFFPFVETPISELTDRKVPLHEFFGKAGNAFEQTGIDQSHDLEQVARFIHLGLEEPAPQTKEGDRGVQRGRQGRARGFAPRRAA
jgi:hypothetical protein